MDRMLGFQLGHVNSDIVSISNTYQNKPQFCQQDSFLIIIDTQRIAYMRSIWDKLSLSRYSIGSQPELSSPNEPEPINNKQMSIDYFELKQLWQKIQSVQSIDVLMFPESNLIQTFEKVMAQLRNVLQIVAELKLQRQANSKKLEQYDKLKSLVGKHSQIVQDLQQQTSQSLNRLYEQKRQLEKFYQQKITTLTQQIQTQSKTIKQLQHNLNEIQQQNDKLSKVKEEDNERIINLQKQVQILAKKLEELIRIDDYSIRKQVKSYDSTRITLQNVFVYSKLRKCLYQFLEPNDFLHFQLTNKAMYYICNRSLKREFLGVMWANYRRQLEEIRVQAKDYEKIIDSFPSDNIRTNAIKYLYFKMKPGAYMLPYFQQDQDHQQKQQKQEQKSKLTQISSFFRKKIDTQPQKQKQLTFESLKNDTDFKQIQKRVETFFDKIFGIEAQTDLKTFNETMKRQLSELKMELKGNQRNMQLLCMSRYLYLEINQLNNLLQVCFALLVHKHQDLKDIKKKNDDLMENDKVLRNLVQNIANDRQQVEKRIFYLETQAVQMRNSEQRLTQQVRKLKQVQKVSTIQKEKYQKELKELKQQRQQQQRQRKMWQQNWDQAVNLIKQIPLLQ